MCGEAAKTVRSLIILGFVCWFTRWNWLWTLRKPQEVWNLTPTHEVVFVSAKVAKVDWELFVWPSPRVEPPGFVGGWGVIFVAKVRENVFPPGLLNKDRQNSSLPLWFWEEDEEEPRLWNLSRWWWSKKSGGEGRRCIPASPDRIPERFPC